MCRATAVEDLYPSYPGLVVVMLQRRAGEIGEALGAYLAALAAGRNWLADHPDTGVEALMATGLDERTRRGRSSPCAVPARSPSRGTGSRSLRELRAAPGTAPRHPVQL